MTDKIREAFEKHFLQNNPNHHAVPSGDDLLDQYPDGRYQLGSTEAQFRCYLAGRQSLLDELEQVGGLYQFGKQTIWWNYSPTYRPPEEFDTEPGQIVRSIQIYRLPEGVTK